MVRKKSQQAVTAKMYTHFAVVTLLATGALAMATDEGTATDFNADVDGRQAAVVGAGQDVKKKAEPKLVRRMAKANEIEPAATGWGPDISISVEDFGIGGSSSIIPSNLRIGNITSGLLRQVGLTPAEFEALSSQEQANILAQINGSTGPSAEQVRKQQAASAAASLARSGGGGMTGSCADC